jgi:hypothetical protein
MDGLSWDPLEMSAERTVAAAAAALMWCGADSQGVLAHIAGRLALISSRSSWGCPMVTNLSSPRMSI